MKHPYLLLLNILLLGLCLRLGLALHKGYEFDVGTNQGWGRSVVENGLGTAYEKQVDGTMIPNYPPFSLAIFGASAYLYRLVSPDFAPHTPLFRIIIKLPAILADLSIAATIFFILKRVRGVKEGLLAALLFVVHPAVWFDSTVWGQTDVLFSLFAFFTVLALATERLWLAGALAALSLLTKVQVIMFFPLFAVLALRFPLRLYKPVIAGSAVIAALFLPFALEGTLRQAVDVMTHSVGFYTDLTVNAYNFWWSMFLDNGGGRHDTDAFMGALTYRQFGYLTVGMLYLIILWRLWRVLLTSSAGKVWVEASLTAGALCAYAFFVFSTEMHERYLFPLMVFGMPVAFLRRQYAVPYLLASVGFYFNMAGVINYTPVDTWFFQTFPAWDAFIGSLHVFVFFLWLHRALRLSLRPAVPFRFSMLSPRRLGLRHPLTVLSRTKGRIVPAVTRKHQAGSR